MLAGRRYKFPGFLLIWMFAFCFCSGQKVLVFENIHTLKNFKYAQGNRISILTHGGNNKLTDEIVDLTDSSMILDFNGEILFSRVSAVYRERYWIDLLSGFTMMAGVFYFSVDSFNRLINSEWPMVDEQTLAISAGLVAIGGLMIPLRFRKIRTGENWKFKMLDPGAF